MLYIIINKSKIIQWHTGEPMPAELHEHRVVEFQADGDELSMIIAAMQNTRKVAS